MTLFHGKPKFTIVSLKFGSSVENEIYDCTILSIWKENKRNNENTLNSFQNPNTHTQNDNIWKVRKVENMEIKQ